MRWLRILQHTWREWRSDDCLQWSAAISYYAALSLAPILVVALSLASTFYGGERLEQSIADELGRLAGPQAQELAHIVLESSDQDSRGRALGGVLGTIMLLLGASGVFLQLQTALNQVWEVEASPRISGWKHFLRVRLASLGMVLAFCFLLLVSLVASAAIAAIAAFAEESLPAGGALIAPVSIVLSLALSTVLFAATFKVLPDVEIQWRDVGVGAALSAVLFAIGKQLIGLYLGHSSLASAYGAAGSLVVLLVWFYYSALIFFFGAELTQVWARHRGSPIVPSRHAVAETDDSPDHGRAALRA